MFMMKRSDFEIMAPVGSYDSLTAAIQGGADSVYFGIEGLKRSIISRLLPASFTETAACCGDLRPRRTV